MAQKKKPLLPHNPNKIVVIQTAFLGDIVLATSFLRSLRALFPLAEIQLVTTPIGVQILTPNSWDIQLVSFDKRGKEKGPRGLFRKIRALRMSKPDLVFCLHRSLRSTILATSLKAKLTVGFKEAAASFLFSRHVARKKFLFEAEKNNALLAELFSEVELQRVSFEKTPELSISEAQATESEKMLEELGGAKFVAMAASSVWATKRWPAEKFGELALLIVRRYGTRSVIIGGNDAEDKKIAARVLASFSSLATEDEKAAAPLDLTGKTSLGALKAVIARATLLISNDSAPLHIGSAQQVPVVAIFGPTTKSLGFFPHTAPEDSIVVEQQGLSCRPCGKHGHDRCPLTHFRCMLDISAPDVLRATDAWLGKDRA